MNNTEPEASPEPEPEPESEPENTLSVHNDSAYILEQTYQQSAELCYILIGVLYLYENHLLLAIFRWILLANFIPVTSPALHRLPIVIFVNAGCILTHLLSQSPKPTTNGTRGYLSGSVILDLVGEPANSSAIKLLAFDLLIFVLQIMMMMVGAAQTKIPDVEDREERLQDIDAEEQGINLARETARVDTDGSIEMQELLPDGNPQEKSTVLVVNLREGIKSLLDSDAASRTLTVSGNDEAVVRALLSRISAART